MFSLVLSLSLATLSPTLPAASITSGAAIAVCFSPEEDCASFAVRAIDNAQHEILVGAYGLTTGSGIVEALVGAQGRRVDVRQARGIIRVTRAGRFHWSVWPRTSSTRTRPGTPEGSHGGAGWPRRLSTSSSRTGASNPAGKVAMAEGSTA